MVLTTPDLRAPEAPPPKRNRSSAGRSIAVALGALLVASVLNAEALDRVAEQQPDGWQRDVATSLTGPLADGVAAVGLDAPRRWIDDALGHEQRGADTFGGGLPVEPTLDRAPLPDRASVTTTTMAPTTTTTAPRRTPTVEDPLRILFAGDSLIGNLADGYARLAIGDPRVATSKDAQVATGLARPDVLDWPSHLQRLLDERNPEVVYLMFGGNDDQPLRNGDQRIELFTPEWRAEYRRRVELMMDIASSDGRTVVWIGVPVVERPRLRDAAKIMNEEARDLARGRDEVFYYTPNRVLAPTGRYAREVGGVVMRTNDGIHVSHEGSDLVAPRLFDIISGLYNLV